MESKPYYNYDVYEDGRVWSNYRQRFLKGSITRYGYLEYGLYINGTMKRIRAHQLVALLFLPNPHHFPMINHMDGDKMNNHWSNLEWCTAYHNNKHARDTGLNDISASDSRRWEDASFRKKTSKHISEGLRHGGCSRGEKNPRFRYRIYFDDMIISRKELAYLLGRSQSNIDALICRAAKGESVPIFEANGITVEDIKKSQSTIENAA